MMMMRKQEEATSTLFGGFALHTDFRRPFLLPLGVGMRHPSWRAEEITNEAGTSPSSWQEHQSKEKQSADVHFAVTSESIDFHGHLIERKSHENWADPMAY